MEGKVLEKSLRTWLIREDTGRRIDYSLNIDYIYIYYITSDIYYIRL